MTASTRQLLVYGRFRTRREHLNEVKLVIIYGSEASGKLTIAKELAARTDLKTFS